MSTHTKNKYISLIENTYATWQKYLINNIQYKNVVKKKNWQLQINKKNKKNVEIKKTKQWQIKNFYKIQKNIRCIISSQFELKKKIKVLYSAVKINILPIIFYNTFILIDWIKIRAFLYRDISKIDTKYTESKILNINLDTLLLDYI